MYPNILPETTITEQIYNEYLRLINYYHNINRSSIFCRYFNINVGMSSYNKDALATFDHYSSGIRYDVYDYTPLYYTAQVVNDGQDQQDLVGQMFSGNLTVTTYTITTPRIEDLIVFAYPPIGGSEIFRVTNIRTPINAKKGNPMVKWYELTLEYAPVMNTKKLNLLNSYVYALNLQKNVFSNEFKRMIAEIKRLEELFGDLQPEFDHEFEMYTYTTDNGRIIAPLKPNRKIYEFLANPRSYKNNFNIPLRPYGVKNFDQEDERAVLLFDPNTGYRYSPGDINGLIVVSLDEAPGIYNANFDDEIDALVVETAENLDLNILAYNRDITVYDMELLLLNWDWDVDVREGMEYEPSNFPKPVKVGFDDILEDAIYNPGAICPTETESE
jgi:hypothetical protein